MARLLLINHCLLPVVRYLMLLASFILMQRKEMRENAGLTF
jgi:hypothetical protein